MNKGLPHSIMLQSLIYLPTAERIWCERIRLFNRHVFRKN
mgnify:CR=1 FL=1